MFDSVCDYCLGEVAVLILADLGSYSDRVVRVRFETGDIAGREGPDRDDLPLVDVFLRVHVIVDKVSEYAGVKRWIPGDFEGRR